MIEKPCSEIRGALSKRIPTAMVAGKITALCLVFLTIAPISCNRPSPFQRIGIVNLPPIMPRLTAKIYYVDRLLPEEEIKEWSMCKAEGALEKNNRLSTVAIIVLYDRKAAGFFSRPRNFYPLTIVGEVDSILFTGTELVKRKTEGGGCLVMLNENNIHDVHHWSFMQRKELNSQEEALQ